MTVIPASVFAAATTSVNSMTVRERCEVATCVQQAQPHLMASLHSWKGQQATDKAVEILSKLAFCHVPGRCRPPAGTGRW